LKPLPTFIIIGAQKSATRWLRMNLGAHPDIHTAAREIGFFSSKERFGRGLDWYRDQFPGWKDEPIVGEATPAYLMWRQRPEATAARMHETLGGIELIAILRNPVDRAASARLHHVQNGRLAPGTKLVEYTREVPPERDPLGLISGGWYAASLRPYRERFGDRVLVLLHDDLALDARGVYDQALHHLGAAPGFVPPGLDRVRFSYRAKLTEEDPVGGDAPSELSSAERTQIYELFRSDVDELQQMIGRDLSMWDPDQRA
jgi:hypothetical protein